ncbi:MAG: nitroreductase family protein [Bacteroidales bacterium]
MEKVHELITKRWSPVAFDGRKVEEDKIALLFEAARWAPSAQNLQPWRFIVAEKGQPDHDALFGLLNEGNREWAGSAPLLVLVLGQVISTYKNRPNRFAFFDAGMAVGNLLLQATAMGLSVHQMGGYDEERAKSELVIPSRYEPISMMAIGYHGDASKLSKNLQERENRKRERMDLDQFVVPGKCK